MVDYLPDSIATSASFVPDWQCSRTYWDGRRSMLARITTGERGQVRGQRWDRGTNVQGSLTTGKIHVNAVQAILADEDAVSITQDLDVKGGSKIKVCCLSQHPVPRSHQHIAHNHGNPCESATLAALSNRTEPCASRPVNAGATRVVGVRVRFLQRSPGCNPGVAQYRYSCREKWLAPHNKRD